MDRAPLIIKGRSRFDSGMLKYIPCRECILTSRNRPKSMLEIYEASVKNVRELKKQAKVLKLLLNQALRTNRMHEVNALTKTYALMYSAYAEVSFMKLVHTPHGFHESYIQQIISCRNLDEKWNKCMEFAFDKISCDHNKGQIANKLKWLREMLNDYIIAPSQIRNKIAHGQWNVCLNNNCTAVNADMTIAVSTLDYVQIDRLFTIYGMFSQCVEDLIESPSKAHYRDFYSRLSELEIYIKKTENYTLESKQIQLQSSPKHLKRNS